MIGESRRHGRCARPPQLGGATAVRRDRRGQGLAHTGMGQDEIVVDLKQYDLLPQALFTLAQRGDTTANGCDMLADGQVEAFDKRRLELPATRG